jgi:crotonobetainyl-CoA:carnitine CoA-transferase CaiB-like acyl-CoA transferase
MTIAGGIAAALFQRERTGVAPVVDVSLLGMAMWMLSPDIVASGLYGGEPMGKFAGRSPMPLVGPYKTKDDRYLTLMLLQGDRFWPELCEHIGRPDLAADERYTTDLARMTNSAEVFALLDETFASRTLEEWKGALATMTGVWAPVQTAAELVDDPMVQANGYLANVHVDGTDFDLVASPVQLDEAPVPLTPAPEHGQHTEEILLELGLDWDEIARGKDSGAIL